jgi:hypothetical protein
VTLALAEPAADGAPRPVRVISQPDQRILELVGALSPDGTAATIDVDRAWLLPGSYVVELSSIGRTPLPLRRYAIVVH